MKKKFKSQEGITLIALVITIILMLILASITVTTIINGGLFNYAGKAKQDTEIASEKQTLTQASILAMAEDKYGIIKQERLQNKIDKLTGEGKTKVYDTGEGFEVCFTESGRYYEVDKEGNIGDYKTPTKDKCPANIFVDEEGNSLDGKEKPYQINSIEDLVMLSNIANGVGNYINENGDIEEITTKNTFSGLNIELTKTLNFNSPTSYADLNLKWSYDAENDAYIIDENSTTTLIEIITDTEGVGFVPIGKQEFHGNLDGQGYEIQNIYSTNEGLIRWARYGTIKNIGVTGIIITDGGAGGIANRTDYCKLFNCYSDVNITGKGGAGGISSEGSNSLFINCYNIGNITNKNGYTGGGITGLITGSTTIVNCYNIGGVQCINHGKPAGGIYGRTIANINVYNCCSIGKNISTHKDYLGAYTFGAIDSGKTVDFNNCYYAKRLVENNANISVNEGTEEITDSNVEEVLNSLNTFVEEHKNDYDVPLANWKMGEDGYPVLDLDSIR